MNNNIFIFIVTSLFLCIPFHSSSQEIDRAISADVCVYGASPAGIFSAIAVAREGNTVVIVEPVHKIGGLLGSGFRMQQDAPSGAHLGGLTGDFYKRDVSLPPLRHYQAAEAFNIATLQAMMDRYKERITVITDHRLESVEKSDETIRKARFEYAPPGKNGVPPVHPLSDALIEVSATIFIDASYEGDLMAFSGVSYRVGKESIAEYGESLAGTVISQTFPGVDPYVEPGNPSSGILSCITPDPLGKVGDSSRFFMGYNFKLAWERNPSKEHPGIPIGPPEKKNKDVYELLKRYKNAGYEVTWPEENFRRGELMTGALPGAQLDYPDGNWEIRSKVWQSFIDHVKTLTDFTQTEFRFISGINEDTDGWPFLYIRGGRRMVGAYVMKQQDLQLQTDIKTPIGLGYYKVDIYPNRLVVLDDGTLAQEGNVFQLVSPGPYQIPYGAITPQKKECQNLLVPLCMSASHVAYSSIRMEATYMVMGESAGIAASLALKSRCAVQDIDGAQLTKKLEQYGQIVKWDGLGYDIGWRSNIFGIPQEETPRWETHPEEYQRIPVSELRK
ncbi:FAD-dependent oxidoreductase [Parapedobacter indicus]|uniref:FAD dependent oxidoreductase n=1 Tax=Parapedobacter indicus TaxID=1477437 RepID=A0A1I3T9E9_9SPHI|nr:FAD-dependent oxidoreductase [Parapedobacter indicus]PPK99626.1 FAD dependent oxidoreductase [Parapedobacter indicus]SFJ66117.1 FAD dependent oxidoreductase [Parapedobacter indicus]